MKGAGFSRFVAGRYLLSSRKSGQDNRSARDERRFVSAIILISAGGIMLGVAALVVTLGILAGFENTLTENVLGFTSNVEISSYGNHPLPDYPGTYRYLRKLVPEIVQLTPFVERQAILRSPRGVAGALVRGIPAGDTTVLAMKRIVTGQTLSGAANDTIDPIIISKGLASELGTGIGKNIAAIRFNERLRTREDILANLHKFRVVGIYSTGMSQYDDMLAYTTLPAAQKFNGFSFTQVSGYDVRTPTLESSGPIAAKINKVLHYPYVARSVFDVYPTIFAWIDLQKKPIPIILGLIILVAAFNIISTLLLIVIEKTRSIGVMKSLGASTRNISRIFITQGMTIAIFGTVMGDLLGFILCALEAHFHFFKLRSEIYFMSSVPVSIEWQHYAIVSVIALVLALTATLIPARIAARMQPLQALNFA